MTSTTSTALIYVEVPHQIPARAFSFDSQEDLAAFLLSTHPQFSYSTYTRSEWEAAAREWADGDEADYQRFIKPGIDLFDAGVQIIAQHTNASGTDEELSDAEDTTKEAAVYAYATHDFHTAYTLDRDATLRAIATGEGIAPHQSTRVRLLLKEEAISLGWLKDDSAA